MKLTTKLIASFILTVLIPTATLGYLSYGSVRYAFEKQTLKDLILVVEPINLCTYSRNVLYFVFN